jgi:hypothetical protein
MNNKYLNKYEKQIYRLPFYTAWMVYIFRFRKFPYFMEYQTFKREKLLRQIVYSAIGIKLIDIMFNLTYILNNKEKSIK